MNSSHRYVIVKDSRDYLGGVGYSGISCDSASIPRGKIYDSPDEATIDMLRLNNVNSVGWRITEYYVDEKYEQKTNQP